MSTLQVDPADMAAAASAAADAGERAAGHDSAAHLDTAASAVPGAGSVGYLSELGSSWDDEIAGWVEDARRFGDDIGTTSAGVEDADARAGSIFGGLAGLLGW